MWLLRECNRRFLQLVTSPTYCSNGTSSKCSNSYLLRSAAVCHRHCSSSPQKYQHSFQLNRPLFRGYHCFMKNTTCIQTGHPFPLCDIQRVYFTPFSTCVQRENPRILNSVNKFPKKSILSSSFHSSQRFRDIPDYLKGSVSEVDNIFDDFLREEFEGNLDDDMTEDILEFLNSRLLLYEETESSFMVPCHMCSSDHTSRSQEIIIDKISGKV